MGDLGETWVFMMSLDSPPTPIKLELYYYFIAVYKSWQSFTIRIGNSQLINTFFPIFSQNLIHKVAKFHHKKKAN
jgi:hypothetical protein